MISRLRACLTLLVLSAALLACSSTSSTATPQVLVITATPAPATPTARVIIVTATAPAPTAALTAKDVVSNVVMAKDTSGEEKNPIGITTTFPANQPIFHTVVTLANAPSDTRVKVAWKIVDASGAGAPDSKMGDYELTTEGTRNLDFTFTPTAGRLPPGKYKVEIYVNDAFNRALEFTVGSSNGSALPTLTASYISKAAMAKEVSGPNKEPVGITDVYPPDTTVFHAVITTADAPQNTVFEVVWTAVDIEAAAAPNTLLNQTETTAEGTRNIDFSLIVGPAYKAWPSGRYKVEVYVNDALDTILNFSVAAPSSTSAPTTTATATTATATTAATISAPPGVYVTALSVNPPNPKRGQPVAFVGTFVNTTGQPQPFSWLVLIYQPNAKKSFGETAATRISVPAGTSQFTSANNWRVTGGGPCMPFYAQPYYRLPDKTHAPFKSTDGSVVSTNFSVCP